MDGDQNRYGDLSRVPDLNALHRYEPCDGDALRFYRRDGHFAIAVTGSDGHLRGTGWVRGYLLDHADAILFLRDWRPAERRRERREQARPGSGRPGRD